MILAGGYAFEVTPEKACWLLSPLRLEKKAIFSADTNTLLLLIFIRERKFLGNA